MTKTIGILGSGQLGRMTAEAAHQMGFKVHTYSPEKNSPTGQIAEKEWVGEYLDEKKLNDFAADVDVVTFEFENVPSATAATLAKLKPLFPNPQTLHICQHRSREKAFFTSLQVPVAPYCVIKTEEDFPEKFSFPAVLKTASSGYDGKGQIKIESLEALPAAFAKLGNVECVLEAFISFQAEASVIGARTKDRSFSHWGLVTNLHKNHILDISSVPSRFSPVTEKAAIEYTRKILEKLDVVGLLCVEFFVTTDGKVIANEMAPRPHNSGHWSIEGSATSQFAQLVRVVTGQPLGPTTIRPSAMANLLGDVWKNGEPKWDALKKYPNVTLHLYGKGEPRPGRKMGHLTAVASTVEKAEADVLAARNALT